MKPAVCHKATRRVPALVLVLSALAAAQTSPDWRKIGGPAVDLSLASPATGPVDQVWFSGGVLFARTDSGRIFQTADFETWAPAFPDVEIPAVTPAQATRLPEAAAQIVAVANDSSSIFGLGRQVSRSQDGGHTWS